MTDVQGEDYQVSYEPDTFTVKCCGSFHLNGSQGYAPITTLFDQVVEQTPPKIILNVEQLKFMNSSGINTLSKFVIKVRKKKTIQMSVVGSQQFDWQDKLLRNLGVLMPGLQFEWK